MISVQVWTKHHGRPAYRKEAQLYLPSRTLQDLQKHEDWYLELLHLQHQKKEVVITRTPPCQSPWPNTGSVVNTMLLVTPLRKSTVGRLRGLLDACKKQNVQVI